MRSLRERVKRLRELAELASMTLAESITIMADHMEWCGSVHGINPAPKQQIFQATDYGHGDPWKEIGRSLMDAMKKRNSTFKVLRWSNIPQSGLNPYPSVMIEVEWLE